jgi:hypothetical protein
VSQAPIPMLKKSATKRRAIGEEMPQELIMTSPPCLGQVAKQKEKPLQSAATICRTYRIFAWRLGEF